MSFRTEKHIITGKNMIKQYRLRDYKFRLVLWVIALTVLGIMIIGSQTVCNRAADHGTDPWTDFHGGCFIN